MYQYEMGVFNESLHLVDHAITCILKGCFNLEKWHLSQKFASVQARKPIFRGRECITSPLENVLHTSCGTPGAAPVQLLSSYEAHQTTKTLH